MLMSALTSGDFGSDEPSGIATGAGASPRLPALAGVRLAARECNVRYKNRTDVMLMELAPGTTIAGVLTRSLTRSAPVDLCRKNLKGGKARAILVNSGNANAFTGKAGVGLGRPLRRRRWWRRSAASRARCSSPRPA